MLPALGFPETKALAHVFQGKASKLVNNWASAMGNSDILEANIRRWLARATLDAISEAAFGYQFGIMDNSNNKLGKTYQDMLCDHGRTSFTYQVSLNNLVQILLVPLVRLTDVNTKAKRWSIKSRGIARFYAPQTRQVEELSTPESSL